VSNVRIGIRASYLDLDPCVAGIYLISQKKNSVRI